jgi:very-short-patch-repair endonuclease
MKTYNPVLIDRARQMRRAMTQAESRLWFEILQKLEPRFRRQRPVGRFIVDFYCAARRLVIEVDGESHNSEEAFVYDQERTVFLESQGMTILRFSNSEVFNNLEGVHQTILHVLFAPAK